MWDEYDKGRTLWFGMAVAIMVIIAAIFTVSAVNEFRRRQRDASHDVILNNGRTVMRPLGVIGGCTLWRVVPAYGREEHVTTCPTSPEK